MYISDKCEYIPYGNDFNLDEKIDEQLKNVDNVSSNDLIEFLKNHKNYGLDVVFNFVQHRHIKNERSIKVYMAEQGYGLDILVNDEEWRVRQAVAKQGYSLDKFINDKDSGIRKILVKQGYGLDILINDKDKDVRSTVAEQGYGLDILVNDDDYGVRSTVAEQGYGLDKLINDENEWVWTVVKMYLDRHHWTLNQWIKKYPNMCVLEHKYNQMEKVTKDFIYKIEESNKLEVQSYYDSIDEFFDLGVDYYTDYNTLEVCSVDTKIPLFEIEKFENNDKTEYKFIIDITNEQGDDFRVRTVIKSKEQLNKLIQQTIDALNIYPEFSKYVDDLENCII